MKSKNEFVRGFRLWAQGDTEMNCFSMKFTTRVINTIGKQVAREQHVAGLQREELSPVAMSRSFLTVLKCKAMLG